MYCDMTLILDDNHRLLSCNHKRVKALPLENIDLKNKLKIKKKKRGEENKINRMYVHISLSEYFLHNFLI